MHTACSSPRFVVHVTQPAACTVVSRYTQLPLHRPSEYIERFYLVTEFIFVTESNSLHRSSGYTEPGHRWVWYSKRQLQNVSDSPVTSMPKNLMIRCIQFINSTFYKSTNNGILCFLNSKFLRAVYLTTPPSLLSDLMLCQYKSLTPSCFQSSSVLVNSAFG